MPHHLRLAEIIEEISPDMLGRGFTPKRGHALWARSLPSGLETVALSFSPDDEEGGWVEPFLGLVEQRVETTMATTLDAPITHGMRHTLLIGATRWREPVLTRQPVHASSEVLEAVNSLLRWIDGALPAFDARFCTLIDEEDAIDDLDDGSRAIALQRTRDLDLARLDELFNTNHPEAPRFLTHELYRAIRGLTIAHLRQPNSVVSVLDFHRGRLIDNGFWEVYGEQIRGYATALL